MFFFWFFGSLNPTAWIRSVFIAARWRMPFFNLDWLQFYQRIFLAWLGNDTLAGHVACSCKRFKILCRPCHFNRGCYRRIFLYEVVFQYGSLTSWTFTVTLYQFLSMVSAKFGSTLGVGGVWALQSFIAYNALVLHTWWPLINHPDFGSFVCWLRKNLCLAFEVVSSLFLLHLN